MKLKVKRIILFVRNVTKMKEFYRDVLGLKIREDTKDWVDFDAGSVAIALHSGGGANETKVARKISFYSDDVPLTRDELMDRGVKMGKVISFGKLRFCDGQDPEGNYFQISNRE